MELLEIFYIGLSNMHQRVIKRNCLFEHVNIRGGILQGSVLDPLLFLFDII